MADDTTTIQVKRDTVRFLQQEGRYTENMAMIVERLLNELRELRAEKRMWQQQGNAEGFPVVA
jgi:hypothetical protein